MEAGATQLSVRIVHDVASRGEALPFLLEAMGASEDLFSVRDLVDSVEDGCFDLWMAYDDDSLCGCFVTELVPISRGIDINVVLAGFNNNFGALSGSIKELMRVSKAAGFNAVRFISKDKRFGSFAKRHGMRRRFIEYVGEL